MTDPALEVAALAPDTKFDNLPDGLLMLWCPTCLASLVFTRADAEECDEPEWVATLQWAVPLADDPSKHPLLTDDAQ